MEVQGYKNIMEVPKLEKVVLVSGWAKPYPTLKLWKELKKICRLLPAKTDYYPF